MRSLGLHGDMPAHLTRDGLAVAFHEGEAPDMSTLSSRGYDDETLLTAFLSWWPCYFIIPGDPLGRIRPSLRALWHVLWLEGGGF